MRKQRLKRKAAAFFIGAALCVSGVAFAEAPLADRIGIAHTRGNYCFTKRPFLLEGAEKVQSLGSRVIKVFLQVPEDAYPFNSSWPESNDIPDIVNVLQTDYFKELFQMDFSTFILQSHLDTADSIAWYDGLDDTEWWDIEKHYYDAAMYLFKTYVGRNVTFILEHWETELYYEKAKQEVLRKNLYPSFDPIVAQQGLIDYFNARAEGVKRARNEAKAKGLTGVTVQTAIEIIYVSTDPSDEIVTDGFRVIDRMDEFRADLVAYDIGNECVQSMELMIPNIQTVLRKSGGRPWYLGEFAAAETRFNPYSGTETEYDNAATRSVRQKKSALNMIDAAFKMKAKYVILWEIYHNENNPGVTDMDGYGLIRKDGSKTALAEYLPSLLTMESIPESEFFGHKAISNLAPGTTLNWQTDPTGMFGLGAVANSLSRAVDIIPGEGLVMHTVRFGDERHGDSHADAGERVTFWVDGKAGMTKFLMSPPIVPGYEGKKYEDSAFLARPTPDNGSGAKDKEPSGKDNAPADGGSGAKDKEPSGEDSTPADGGSGAKDKEPSGKDSTPADGGSGAKDKEPSGEDTPPADDSSGAKDKKPDGGNVLPDGKDDKTDNKGGGGGGCNCGLGVFALLSGLVWRKVREHS